LALLELRQMGDPVLRQRAEAVPKVSRKIKELLIDMAETMYAAPGVGLAAPQVGISKRIIVVDVGEGLIELVNPVLVRNYGSETATEGCLSIPGIVGEVTRAEKVVVNGLDGKGRRVEIVAEGLLARALQHELDHLDGVLFIDKATNLRHIEEDDDAEEKGGPQ
jgi:peptide deformylase